MRWVLSYTHAVERGEVRLIGWSNSLPFFGLIVYSFNGSYVNIYEHMQHFLMILVTGWGQAEMADVSESKMTLF